MDMEMKNRFIILKYRQKQTCSKFETCNKNMNETSGSKERKKNQIGTKELLSSAEVHMQSAHKIM